MREFKSKEGAWGPQAAVSEGRHRSSSSSRHRSSWEILTTRGYFTGCLQISSTRYKCRPKLTGLELDRLTSAKFQLCSFLF